MEVRHLCPMLAEAAAAEARVSCYNAPLIPVIL
jgi:hypothetical protein